jgi:PAS domain S-box-containing protein
VPHRFDAQIDQLRASLSNKTGEEFRHALATALESLAVAAVATDSQGRYVAANRAAEMLTGYSREELTTLTVMDLTPARSVTDGESLWADFIESGVQSGTYELRRKGRTAAPVRYWAFTNIAPGIHLSLLKPESMA